ncbi:MAG: hypothetical protein GXY17_02820 [Clostridiaceae bacterium]|jgi:thioredoxin reductase|nr:hypothetical protein [Clostridiaceae bacterium]
MKAEYDAIVVGGGIAGLTSAAYLCHSGARTLLPFPECSQGKGFRKKHSDNFCEEG